MKKILLLILLSVLLIAEQNQTEELSFFDKEDGKLDLSEYLSTAYGFLPVPIVITEPAVGYGAGLSLVYLHDNFTGQKLDSGRVVPASMSGAFYMKTENGTNMGGAFHVGYYFEDNLRTISFVGIIDININTYVYPNDKPVSLSSNIEGPIIYQALKVRVLDTNLFLGGAYMYSAIDTAFDKIPSNFDSSSRNASLDLILEYDARNSTLSPTSGYFINLKSNFFREEVGSDKNFEKYIVNGFFYVPVNDTLNINFKLTAESIGGEEAPFYSYPFVTLRGLPSMQVQGEHTLSSELELCWEFSSRWEALVFGGVGKAFGQNQFANTPIANLPTAGDTTSFSEAKNEYTKGIGFRYLIAKKFGLKMGIDIASSEYDNAVYLQMGSAWAGF